MPLRYEILPGPNVRVSQSFDPPTVYFDHWAVRRLSDDSVLQDRFVAAMKASGGTLLMSHMNFVEFAGSEEASHSDAAGVMLDRLLPNIYFTELNLDKAIAREEAFNNDPRMPPPVDAEMLDMVAHGTMDFSQPFSIKTLLTQIYEARDRLGPEARDTNRSISDRVIRQRQDSSFVSKARNSVPSLNKAKTKLLMGELLRSSILDTTDAFTPNDAADFQHAILAGSYCDFVLLDGKWADRIEKARRRLNRHGVALRLARCFSERKDGLKRFLQDLEAYVA